MYFDHAASTPVDSAVLRAMNPYFTQVYANASSLYALGVEARRAVEQARETVAGVLGSQKDTILFTSGATEANNMALMGSTWVHGKNPHIITTTLEHSSVLRPIQELEKNCGFSVTYLKPNHEGFVFAHQVKSALRNNTILISIGYANNEIGTVQPIAEIGKEILKWRKEEKTALPYFHSDAAQAPGALDISVEKLHVDFMTLNGSKIYGPKGVGVLYKRRNVPMHVQSYGGKQEFGLRAGTENVPGIVGFAKALEIAEKIRVKSSIQISELRNYFWKQLQKHTPHVVLNGPQINVSLLAKERNPGVANVLEGMGEVNGKKYSTAYNRLPNNLNVSFESIEAEVLMLYLDAYGIMCSTGSACSTDSDEPSHVLLACGYSKHRANSSLRFTLGKHTEKKDIDMVIKYLSALVKELRKNIQV